MARYLIYSTGTTYSGTILRDNGAVVPTPTPLEASFDTLFVIPEIQPLYLWQVNNVVTPTTLIPNTDIKINLYEEATALAPTPQDLITYGEVTGMTNEKISKVTGATAKVPVFTAGGGLQSSGYSVPELTGLTTYTFQGSGGTHIHQSGNNIIIQSVTPSGTTVWWADVLYKPSWLSGDTLADFEKAHTHAQYLAKTTFTGYTASTGTALSGKVDKVTGVTNNIGVFDAGGNIISAGKQFRTDVRGTGSATDAFSPTEKAVRDAITSALFATIKLQGDWNATTNTPNLTGTTTGSTGYAWRVSVSGTTSLGGLNLWKVGDLAVKTAVVGQWIRIVSQDIAAIWGNIGGTLSDQTDLQQALNAKVSQGAINTYTGTTAPNTFAYKSSIQTYTGTTAPAAFVSKASNQTYTGTTAPQTFTNWTTFGNYTGTTAPAAFVAKSSIQTYTGTTAPAQFVDKGSMNTFSGTTLPSKYVSRVIFTGYTATTNTAINSKLNIAIFTGYTASTANVSKKIQLVSTLSSNANVVSPLPITWNSTSVSANTYLWSGGSTVWIKSAGNYELLYHVVLKNDAANQTHSVGGYIVKNGATLPLTATAGMAVGVSASGELSLPPTVLTFALNDRLDLAVFRIGSSGNANLVSGSVYLMINKLS